MGKRRVRIVLDSGLVFAQGLLDFSGSEQPGSGLFKADADRFALPGFDYSLAKIEGFLRGECRLTRAETKAGRDQGG